MFLELNLFNHSPSHSRDNPLSSSDLQLDPPTFSCPQSCIHLPLHIPQGAQNLFPWAFASTTPSAQNACPALLQSNFFLYILFLLNVSYQLGWSHFLCIFKINFLVLILTLGHLQFSLLAASIHFF